MKRTLALIAPALLLMAFLPSLIQAQPFSLPSTWTKYDLQSQVGYSAGLLSVSGESSTGFTALVGSNGVTLTYPSKSQFLPRVVSTFAGQPITNNGQRVTFAFDVRFNNIADPANTGSFRISVGDTNCNNGYGAFWPIGNASGSVTFRYDTTITQDTNWFDPGNGYYLFEPFGYTNALIPTNISYGSFCDLSGSSVGGAGGSPSGAFLGNDTTNVHHIRFSVERTPSGLQVDTVWRDNGSTNAISAAVAPLVSGNGDDHSGLINVSPWTNVNVFGFCLFGTGANEHFFGYNPGSYTISNLKAYSGFNLTAISRDSISNKVTLTWESTAADVCQYIVLRSPDLASWTPIVTNSTGGYLTSYTDTNSAGNANYYRVAKSFPSP